MNFDEAVERIPFLRALAAEELDRLRPYALSRRVSRGERIWAEGDATGEFTFLADGRVKLVKAGETGRDVIVDVRGPGELLCSSAVCCFAPYCCSSTALEDAVEVLVLPRRDLFDLLERSPSASRAFLREVTARDLGLPQRIAQLSSGQVDRRIAALFGRLADQVGTPRDEGGIWIPVALSRQDLADLCGTTLETAIRVMSRLSREGILKTVGRGFVLTSRERLDAILRGAP